MTQCGQMTKNILFRGMPHIYKISGALEACRKFCLRRIGEVRNIGLKAFMCLRLFMPANLYYRLTMAHTPLSVDNIRYSRLGPVLSAYKRSLPRLII